MKPFIHKKLQTRAIVAVVLLLVLAVNLLGGALLWRNRWIVDLTNEELYTVAPIYRELLDTTFREVSEKRQENGEEPVKVNIIFCDEPDVLTEQSSLRYVYFTALALQRYFPDYISVECVNVAMNPSAVQAYRANSASRIYPTSVIVSSGSEFRVYSTKAFYYFDSSDYSETDPIGYCGDKTFTQAIRNVTSASSPVCCLISNHGETYGNVLVDLIRDAGYRVVEDFDLRRDPIPQDCRLMISSGAKTDFYAVFGDTTPDGDDEIDKLSAFLDGAGSFLFFFDPGTPKLANIEEYLTEWGMVVDRFEGQAFRVTDEEYSISTDGASLIGQYVQTGLGASMLSDLLSSDSPEQVVFPECGSISRPDSYKLTYTEENSSTQEPSYSYWHYSSGGINRTAFDLFLAGENAKATAGTLVSNTGANRLMSISSETRMLSEDQGYTFVTEASYVMACGSTAFLSDEVLGGARFGNTDVMLSILRILGRDVNPVSNVFRMFHETEIGTAHTFGEDTLHMVTLLLCTVPAVILLGTCVIVMVKRKNRE